MLTLVRKYATGLVLSGAYLAFCVLLASQKPVSQQSDTLQQQIINQRTEDRNSVKAHVQEPGLPVTAVKPSERSFLQQYSLYCSGNPSSEEDKWRHKFWCEFDLSDAVIAAFTVIATIITGLLVFIGLWEVFESRASTRRQLRAYVSAQPNFISSSDGNTFPWANFELKNGGQTPAKNMSHCATIQAMPYPLPQDYVVPTIENSPSPATILPPGTPLVGTVTALRPFSPDEIDGIQNGSRRIYVYGILKYQDVFGKWRTTNFGSSVKADADALVKLTTNYLPSDLKISFEVTRALNDFT